GHDQTITAAPGEDLYSLGRHYRLGLEHLAFANNLAVSLAPVGPTSLVLPGRRILPANPPADGLVLNLPERGIFLFKEGKFRDFYPVAVGSPDRQTPVGEYKIIVRTVNPTWLPPEWAGITEPVGPGPENPLGDRWMGLSRPGYGIHSTNSPSSIGGAVSHGCIRMYPELARELFELVKVGMPVRIEYEPVKLGWDEESCELYLCVLPDMYGKVNLMAEAERKLAEVGATDLVDPTRLKILVDRASGKAEKLAGGRVLVKVDGNESRPPGLIREGRLWVGTELLEQLGVQPQEGMPTATLGTHHLVPAADVLPGYGYTPVWENGSVRVERITIASPPVTD
ncbi:MAG: L,D-transpeptidase, partial [Candidatus Eremiobacteraeota bacterium]|nr:L,D-transpeptidase [Candidatus Eremiobacteraeota bacterium]